MEGGNLPAFTEGAPCSDSCGTRSYGHRNSSVCNDELLSEMTGSVAGCTLLKMNADNS